MSNPLYDERNSKRRSITRADMSAPGYEPRTRASAIAFQFTPDRFLGSTIVGKASHEEFSILVRLICLDWQEDGFEYDPVSLAWLCHVQPAKFKRAWVKLREHFVELPNGRFTDPYLENERDRIEGWRRKSSQGGKASAASRAKGGSTTVQEVVELPLAPPANQQVNQKPTTDSTTCQPERQPNGKPPVSGLRFPASTSLGSTADDEAAAAPSSSSFDLTPTFAEVAMRLTNDYHRDAFAGVVLSFPADERASVVENVGAYINGDPGYKQRDVIEVALGLIDYRARPGNLKPTIRALRAFIDRAENLYTQPRAKAAESADRALEPLRE